MTLVERAEEAARSRFEGNMPYHNLDHTENFVANVKWLCDQLGIDGTDRRNLKVAGWLHDVGAKDGYVGHVERSAEIAEDILQTIAEEYTVDEIRRLILATDPAQQTEDLLEQVMQDADSICAYANGMDTQRKLYEEFKQEGMVDSWSEHVDKGIDLVSDAEFHTSPARQRAEDDRKQTLEALRQEKESLEDE
jgi:predicted metal-dependent HD superfamily phosphohydrolase